MLPSPPLLESKGERRCPKDHDAGDDQRIVEPVPEKYSPTSLPDLRQYADEPTEAEEP